MWQRAIFLTETISRTDKGHPRPKYIFNKCGTNLYFFLLYRGLVHHHRRIFNQVTIYIWLLLICWFSSGIRTVLYARNVTLRLMAGHSLSTMDSRTVKPIIMLSEAHCAQDVIRWESYIFQHFFIIFIFLHILTISLIL